MIRTLKPIYSENKFQHFARDFANGKLTKATLLFDEAGHRLVERFYTLREDAFCADQ